MGPLEGFCPSGKFVISGFCCCTDSFWLLTFAPDDVIVAPRLLLCILRSNPLLPI
uniref:Uncharacterized protein n=1 Tax=Lepeophtheirus salmonis TaxID=72036 RepID=A0A0K2TWN3_LEPSM